MTIKAIETTYKGYRFRSRLEARWAVFFDVLGIEWEYEKEGYELSPEIKYLPDFYFPLFDCFGEVKPNPFTVEEYQKCYLLPKKCLLLDTPHPQAKSYYLTGSDILYSQYEKDGYGRVIFCHSVYKGNLWFLLGESHSEYGCACVQAEDAAKSARFEFGEKGGLE